MRAWPIAMRKPSLRLRSSRLDHVFFFYRCAQTTCWHICASMVPESEAVRTTFLVCDEPGCENQPRMAKPGHTTGKPEFCLNPTLPHFVLPASVLRR